MNVDQFDFEAPARAVVAQWTRTCADPARWARQQHAKALCDQLRWFLLNDHNNELHALCNAVLGEFEDVCHLDGNDVLIRYHIEVKTRALPAGLMTTRDLIKPPGESR